MSGCGTHHDISIIRGDSYRFVSGLADGFSFVADAPEEFRARMVIRDGQFDDLPDILEMESLVYPGTDTRFPNMVGFIQFIATPAQTQALPDYDVVYFCELIGQNGNYVRRLFDGRVRIGD